MPGLLIVGMVHAAAEADVALAAAESLGAEPVTLLDEATASSPLTAARHAGYTIDPQELIGQVAAAGEDVVVAVGGGLLAPITPRYSVRDLAADIGLPLVLAAPAGADAVGLLRLGAEAARGAGLAVAAFVLTGWPGDPGRVLLDELKLLEELAGKVPVAVLGDDRGWDPSAWLQTTAAPDTGQAVVAASRMEAALDPYDEWEPFATGDPRHTPRPRIMEAMHAIVAAEGPMRASRAFALYNRASGGKKLTTVARVPLASAVHWLAQERKIVLTKEQDIPWQGDDLVRAPDSPAVRVRELGPRTLEEVPLDEIAELMRRIRAARGISGENDLKRAVLSTYGLIRMTAKADEYLGLAYGLMSGDAGEQ
jgi:hypothetical protein